MKRYKENIIKNFECFKVNEGLNYNLFRGIHGNDSLKMALDKGYFSDSGEFENVIRKSLAPTASLPGMA
jgi:hypothetical protein